MKIFELSQELNVTNKETITFLKEHGYSVSSHMQNATDEMVDLARKELKSTKTNESVKNNKETQTIVKPTTRSTKIFKEDDVIMYNIIFLLYGRDCLIMQKCPIF